MVVTAAISWRLMLILLLLIRSGRLLYIIHDVCRCLWILRSVEVLEFILWGLLELVVVTSIPGIISTIATICTWWVAYLSISSLLVGRCTTPCWAWYTGSRSCCYTWSWGTARFISKF
jgi:hypothetical protein